MNKSANKLIYLLVSAHISLLSSIAFAGDADKILLNNAIAKVTDIQLSNCLKAGKQTTYSAEIDDITCFYESVTSIEGIENFTGVTRLTISSNQLTQIDISKNTKLGVLRADSNKLTSINISKNTKLKGLWLWDNRLSEIDLSSNPMLARAGLNRNQLTKLDISKNKALMTLDVSNNKISRLDLTHNKQLTTLDLEKNKLVEIDVSNNNLLFQLDLRDNLLTEVPAGLLKLKNKFAFIYLKGNPFSEQAKAELSKLKESLPRLTF